MNEMRANARDVTVARRGTRGGSPRRARRRARSARSSARAEASTSRSTSSTPSCITVKSDEARLAEPGDGRERCDGDDAPRGAARRPRGPRHLEREAREQEPVAEALALRLVPVDVELVLRARARPSPPPPTRRAPPSVGRRRVTSPGMHAPTNANDSPVAQSSSTWKRCSSAPPRTRNTWWIRWTSGPLTSRTSR